MKEFIVTTEDVQYRYGDNFKIRTNGISLKRFSKNPVMRWQHSDPIGTWENVRLVNSDLYATPVFDEVNELSKEIKQKVELGSIKGASISIENVKWGSYIDENGQEVYEAISSDLSEISIVDVPNNENALSLQLSKKDEKSLQEFIKLSKQKEEVNEELIKKDLEIQTLTEKQNELALELESKSNEINLLVSEVSELKDQIQLSLNEKKTEMIETAIKLGKLSEANRNHFMELSLEIGKSIIDNLPSTTNHSLINDMKQPNKPLELSKDFGWFLKNDIKGLELMKETNPNHYKTLYETHYKIKLTK